MHYGNGRGTSTLNISYIGAAAKKNISYSWRPNMTFEAYFDNPTVLEDVVIVTENSAGEKTNIPAVYDETTGAWVGSHEYLYSYKASANIYACPYNSDSLENSFNDEITEAMGKGVDALVEGVQSILDTIPENEYTIENVNQETDTGDFYFNDLTTGEQIK